MPRSQTFLEHKQPCCPSLFTGHPLLCLNQRVNLYNYVFLFPQDFIDILIILDVDNFVILYIVLGTIFSTITDHHYRYYCCCINILITIVIIIIIIIAIIRLYLCSVFDLLNIQYRFLLRYLFIRLGKKD